MTGAFSDAEVRELRTRYRQIFRVAPNQLQGWLELDAVFDGVRVQDRFEVRIEASERYPEKAPTLEEIGGRTDLIKTKRGITSDSDVHRNSGRTACVCVEQREREKFPPGSTVLVFVEQLAVPYLYALSRFEATGAWPWGDQSHGLLGMIEYYGESVSKNVTQDEIANFIGYLRRFPEWPQYSLQLESPDGTRKCVCGSEKAFGECHPRVVEGFRGLRTHAERLGFELQLAVESTS